MTFEPTGQSALQHYLHACVLNKIRGKAVFHGAQKRAGDLPLTESLLGRLPAGRDREPSYLDSPRYERLEDCLRRLPESLREVVLLRRIEGLSNTEAAEVLDKSPAACSKLHARAMARLGTLMRDSEPETSA